MNTVHLSFTKGYLDWGLTGLHRRVVLGMHCKGEKIGVEPMSISPDNP